MGEHGQGDVAVSADVAPDLVLVQAALVLRGLEVDAGPLGRRADALRHLGVAPGVQDLQHDRRAGLVYGGADLPVPCASIASVVSRTLLCGSIRPSG